ncbi:hypothetical protein BVRB_7g173010 [Beta vulgaris subsp. vulgaris]|nr:hypothetical protein BVRB_7g173010 [Beta vulgaris subsp. vulgaris]
MYLLPSINCKLIHTNIKSAINYSVALQETESAMFKSAMFISSNPKSPFCLLLWLNITPW